MNTTTRYIKLIHPLPKKQKNNNNKTQQQHSTTNNETNTSVGILMF